MERVSITNEQLGAVYLKIDGLDKERFKKLTKGMKFYNTVEKELNDGYSYIEYYNSIGGFEWLSTASADEDAQLITLDELEERLFTLPEKWCIKVTEENKETLANWRSVGDPHGKIVKGSYNGWYLYTPMGGVNGYGQQNKEEGYTEITFEQFKKHVLKQNDMKTEQQPQTFKVTRQTFAEILPHVCSDYRDKINKLAQEDLFSNEIEVSESIVRQVHKDATKTEQRNWLDKYLPLPKKKKIHILGILLIDNPASSGVDTDLSTRSNYKLITLANNTYKYDIFSAEWEGITRVYYGYWGDGVTED